MAKAKDILKKFTVAAIATAGIMLAGNSLQAQAATVEPEEVTLASDVSKSEELFGSIDELPDGSWIGSDSLLPEEAEENQKLDEAENMTQSSDAEDASDDAIISEATADEQLQLDVLMLTKEIKPVVVEVLDTDATTGTDTATADADASVDVPSQDITDEDADAVEAGEDKILDEGFAVDGVDTDEVETPSTSESEVSDAANATEATDEDDWLYADADDKELVPEVKGDSMVESKSTVNVDDDDDWMYVDFDAEPEVKGDDIITPEEPTVPEEPQPQPTVPETPILTEPTVQPMQTPVVLGDSLWTAPKTGDTLIMIAVCIIAALLAAGVIVLSLQRKRKKEERRCRTRFSPMVRPDHLIDSNH